MEATNTLTQRPPSGSGARRKFLFLAGLLVVLVSAGGAGVCGTGAAGAPAPTAAREAGGNAPAAEKIAPDLRGTFHQAGPGARLQYWVILADQADTRNTIPNSRWADKGWYVYNLLTAKAAATQAPLLAQLQTLHGAGLVSAYQSFWIINSLMVTGDLASAQALAAQTAVARVRLPAAGMIADDGPPTLSAAAQAVLDQALADVRSTTPSHLGALLAPLTIQHNLNEVHAPQAWALGYDGTGITVGSMDTGVRWTHEALRARYRGVVAPPDPGNIHDYNWFDGYHLATTPTDNNGHGSHTMGTLVGTSPDPAYGNIGVAPGAQWITVRVCSADGSNNCDPTALLLGFQWTLAPSRVDGTQPNPAYRPRVANNSWGSNICTAPDWQTAVTNWVNAGIFPDFAAGNGGPGAGTIDAPASYANAWATGNLATSVANWVIYPSSSRGPSCWDGSIRPQAVAPGTNICAAINAGDTAYDCLYTGTSMATPHIAGAVAVLLQKNPALTMGQMVFAITSTAFFSPSWGTAPNNTYGWGLLQLDAALNAVPLPGTPTPTVTGTPLTATRTPPPPATRTVTPTRTPALASATPTGCVPRAATWTDLAPYPLPIEWGAMAAQAGHLYSFGGFDSVNGLAAAYLYDPGPDTWSSLPALPDIRFVHSVVSDGTYLYILSGGDSTGATHTVYRYDPATNTYTTTASIPTATGGQTAVYLNGKIYRIGGCITANCSIISNSVEAYTISTDSWASKAPYPFGVVWSSAVAYGGYIYTAGAAYAGANQVKTYRYDPTTDTWDDAAITDLPAPRDSAAFGLVGTEFVLASGRSNGVLTDTVWALDLRTPTGTWDTTTLPRIPHREYWGNSAALDGQLYAVGGVGDFGLTDYTQRLSLAVACGTPSGTPSATPTRTLLPTLTRTPTVTPTVLPCGLAWRVVTSPNGSTYDNRLAGVAVVGPADIWAVGSDTALHRTLTQHWNGSGWSVVASPNIGGSVNYLYGVAAVGPNDVWAVGYSAPFGDQGRTLIQHWDGSAWNIIPSPNVGVWTNLLNGVAAVGATDVWAVGSYYVNFAQNRTLIEHWDGTAWNVIASPSPDINRNILNGVAVVGPNDAWAVGSYDTVTATQTLILHWDGSLWTIVPSPNVGTMTNDLMGLAVVNSSDIWAVGYYADVGGPDQTLTEHWDGTAWSLVPSPNVGTSANRLDGVAALTRNAVWAVGAYANVNADQTLVEYWNGTAWSVVPSPNANSGNNSLHGVAVVGATDVWAAGEYLSSTDQTLIEHYHDPCLTPTPTPPGATPTACAIRFSDVDPTNPFYPFIRCLACRGIVSGYADGTFRWGNAVTRGQLAKIVVGAAGLNNSIPSTQQTFSDVPGTNAFWLWVERLVATGAISGYACGGPGEPCDPLNRPYFRWGANATRGQIAKIIGVAGHISDPIPTTQQTFTDVPTSNAFWLFIERLAGRGIISGYTCGGPGEPCDPQQRPYFRWGAAATRGQLAKIAAQTFYPNCQTPARP